MVDVLAPDNICRTSLVFAGNNFRDRYSPETEIVTGTDVVVSLNSGFESFESADGGLFRRGGLDGVDRIGNGRHDGVSQEQDR